MADRQNCQPGIAEPETCPPSGFLTSQCRRWQRGASWFAQWHSSSDAGPNAATPTFGAARQFVSTGECSPCWWLVYAWGRSVVTQTVAPIEPASESILTTAPRNSRARLQIRWADASGGTERDITIGDGVGVAVYGCGVTCSVLAPSGAFWGPRSSTGSPVPTLSGTVVSESVGVAVYEAHCAPGPVGPAYLVDVVAGADAAAQIAVPPGARILTVSQSGAVALSTYSFTFGGGVVMPVVLGTTTRRASVSVPTFAEVLAVNNIPAGTNVMANWELDL